jgi:hypothetical protein
VSLPPLVMRWQVSDGRRGLPLWIPLFLLWPLALVLLLVLSPFLLVAAAVMWGGAWCRRLPRVAWVLLRCLGSLRGLELDFQKGGERVRISMK